MSEKFSKFDIVEFLDDKETRQHYLNEVIADGDLDEFKRAIFYIAKAEHSERTAEVSNKFNQI